jgi:hypothetical protein
MELSQIAIAVSGTHHCYKNEPLYNKRFQRVLKFHQPGLAPVTDETGAYHINLQGEPHYVSRYLKTFGFYQNLAAVVDVTGWFHIKTNDEPLYSTHYRWCGNYQENACVVEDFNHHFFHLDREGQRLYLENYVYAGDFHDGSAVVQTAAGRYTHINQRGDYIHHHYFLDLDVYHKGFARAKDQVGWFHIDLTGQAVYSQRYNMIEPFYNGYARCETQSGALIRINEQGEIVEQLKPETTTPFQQLSADIVGYWRTQTIKAAVDLNLFDYLPATLAELVTQTGIAEAPLMRFIRALQEIGLIIQLDEKFIPTQKAEFLSEKHPLSLKYAVRHWANAHYLAWMSLGDALKQNKAMYDSQFGQPLFDWLDSDPTQLTLYHQAMSAYARHDYPILSQFINTEGIKLLVDAAGGEGVLLQFILRQNPLLHGVLLERESVVAQLSVPLDLHDRLKIMGFDLLKPWPIQNADIITLSRVLHDWDDTTSKLILLHARNTLAQNGRLIIIEFLVDPQSANGGMLDMNMLVIAGGQERELTEFIDLAASCDLQYLSRKTQGAYTLLEFVKDDHV